jgi:hypothetical protein
MVRDIGLGNLMGELFAPWLRPTLFATIAGGNHQYHRIESI